MRYTNLIRPQLWVTGPDTGKPEWSKEPGSIRHGGVKVMHLTRGPIGSISRWRSISYSTKRITPLWKSPTSV